ncbi:hypothetical protein FRB98_005105 [Tulasnella sp. 332]|nr:hypothetical protein FRB98_005105 [Tulasnella sp. 332]
MTPSVPLQVKKTWIAGGGTLSNKYSTTNWFFYNGANDPDLMGTSDLEDEYTCDDEIQVERMCIVMDEKGEEDEIELDERGDWSVLTLASSTSTAASQGSGNLTLDPFPEGGNTKYKEQALKMGLKIVRFMDGQPETFESRPGKWLSNTNLSMSERLLAADNHFHHSLPVFSVEKLLSLSQCPTFPPPKFDHITDFKPGLVYRKKVFSAKPMGD